MAANSCMQSRFLTMSETPRAPKRNERRLEHFARSASSSSVRTSVISSDICARFGPKNFLHSVFIDASEPHEAAMHAYARVCVHRRRNKQCGSYLSISHVTMPWCWSLPIISCATSDGMTERSSGTVVSSSVSSMMRRATVSRQSDFNEPPRSTLGGATEQIKKARISCNLSCFACSSGVCVCVCVCVCGKQQR